MINKIREYFKGISSNVRVLAVGSFFNDVSSEMVYPLLPVFLTMLGATKGFIGVIEGIAESTASFVKIFSGWYSDKLRARKNIAVTGYAISGLTRPIVAIAKRPWHVLTARFADRIGKGVRTSPRDALLSASVKPEARAKAFGFHRAMDNSGALVGPAVAMFILWLKPDDYSFLFWMATIPTAIAVFVIWKWAEDVNTPLPAGADKPNLSWSALDSRFKAYIVVLFVFTLSNSSDAFLILRAEELGVKDYMLPLLWIVLHFVKTITNIPGGGLADRWGRRRIIIAGWLLYALIYAGFAIAQVEWHVWVLFALYGVYFGMTEGAERALVSDLAPEAVRGTAYGFFHLAVGLGALPASMLFGYLWDRFNGRTAFVFSAALALFASLLLAVSVRSEAQKLTKVQRSDNIHP